MITITSLNDYAEQYYRNTGRSYTTFYIPTSDYYSLYMEITAACRLSNPSFSSQAGPHHLTVHTAFGTIEIKVSPALSSGQIYAE